MTMVGSESDRIKQRKINLIVGIIKSWLPYVVFAE